jgi:hypothetical protein
VWRRVASFATLPPAAKVILPRVNSSLLVYASMRKRVLSSDCKTPIDTVLKIRNEMRAPWD